MKKYEYKVQTVNNDKSSDGEQIEQLNSLGKDGWELVSTLEISGMSDGARFYLRREISD